MSKVSIIGAYNTEFGAFVKKDKATGMMTDTKTYYDLLVEAGRGAIADAGLGVDDLVYDDLRRFFDDEMGPADEEDVRFAPQRHGIELDAFDAVDVQSGRRPVLLGDQDHRVSLRSYRSANL